MQQPCDAPQQGLALEEKKSLISFLPGPCFGWVKFEPWFHSAISAGLRGVSPKRIRVLRASLAAAAAAARAAARH